MNRKVLVWAMAVVVAIPIILGGGYWLYWSQIKRYEPAIIQDPLAQIEIQKLLDQSGAVSPGADGSKLWLITYRDCGPCLTYQREEFPALQAAGVNTQVIVFIRPDDKGLQQSTPAERTTVAELWLNRSWELYQAWLQTPEIQWKAEDLIPADTDLARQGVVLATQAFIARLTQHLSKDRVAIDYPLVLYRDKNNQLKACACTHERSFGFVRHDMGVPGAPLLSSPAEDLKLPSMPSWLGGRTESKPVNATEPDTPAEPASVEASHAAPSSAEIEEATPITDAGDW